MQQKKILVVFGATGAQGGGLVRAILDDINSEFAVRAISISNKEKNTQLLKLLIKNHSDDVIWQSTTAIELMASSNDKFILRFASKIPRTFLETRTFILRKYFLPEL